MYVILHILATVKYDIEFIVSQPGCVRETLVLL